MTAFDKDADRPRAQPRGERFGLVALLRRGQHDGALGPQQLDLALEVADAARTKDHA